MDNRIYDFSKLKTSDRNGTYGGNSGNKEGVLINDEYWLIKYPKSTKDLNNVGSLSYSTSPISEYIGSHIYNILGYPVHETMLGVRNNKLVVACKDLCDDTHRLIEFRQLKNTYNQKLSEALETHFTSTGSQHFVGLEEVITHLKYNPEINKVPGIEERFWECMIIDGFINNNDRNNGNWGILRDKNESVLAPIYDNGSSFSPNVPESRLIKKLNNQQSLESSACNGVTAYSLDGEHNLLFRDAMQYNNKNLKQAIIKVVPNITLHISEIQKFIDNIPEKINGIEVLSPVRKEIYQKEMDIRMEKIMAPAYEKNIRIEKHPNTYSFMSFDDMLANTSTSTRYNRDESTWHGARDDGMEH